MSWFDKQIRAAAQSDQEIFEESLLRMASVVLNDKGAEEAWNERIITREAIDEILKYYHFKPVRIPDQVTVRSEQLEYCLRPYGIMRREVLLKGRWYKDSFGPLLVFREKDGRPVALIPGLLSSYTYTDPLTGTRIKLTEKNAMQFRSGAICFYMPLPSKELHSSDLIKFLHKSISRNDKIRFFRLTAFAALVGMLTLYITRFMTGVVIRRGDLSLLLGSAVFLICSMISQQLINMVKALGVSRMRSEGRIKIESALMMRLISLPASFFRSWSAGELYRRFRCVTDLTETVIDDVYVSGTTAVMSLIYILQIFSFTPSLDNRTQKKIAMALDQMNCTRIVIAHRLSTIKNCDRILMLDKGRIAEDGTYEELIAKNGLAPCLSAVPFDFLPDHGTIKEKGQGMRRKLT